MDGNPQTIEGVVTIEDGRIHGQKYLDKMFPEGTSHTIREWKKIGKFSKIRGNR